MSWTDRFNYPKQVRDAAEQMWAHVRAGRSFEVPLKLDANDPAMLAVFLMQKNHKEVRLGYRQSKSIVVGLEDTWRISNEVKALLEKGGQLAKDPKTFISDIAKMLGEHEKFIIGQGLNPAEMEREAQEAEFKKRSLGELRGLEPTEAQAATTNDIAPRGDAE